MGCKIVKMSTKLFEDILTEGWSAGADGHSVHCVEGVPPGASVVDILPLRPQPFISSIRIIHILIEHPDWPDVPIGKEPTINIVYKRERIDDDD